RFVHRLGAVDVKVKWPNDLVIGECKLGGILVEHRGGHGGRYRVVAGIGLNLGRGTADSARIGQPVASLAGVRSYTGAQPPSRNRVAAGMIEAVLGVCRTFAQDGFAPWRAVWPRYDAARDRTVSIRMPTTTLTGVARGVDSDGALLLDTDEGRRRIYSGEVS